MIPNVTEILLILAIVVLTFGVGKVKNIGAALGRSGKEFKNALDGDDEPDGDEPIDITPAPDDAESPVAGAAPESDPKPGTKKQTIEDAEVIDEH